MDRDQWLAKHFDADRARLRQVAYRFLGSLTEADDAVQEAWLRLSRSEARSIDNLSGWLTTVVARVCLDMLRARKSREEALRGAVRPAGRCGGDRGSRAGGTARRFGRPGVGGYAHRDSWWHRGDVRGSR
jgi:DNA-directed RNA polymerase specialized sigma24 family protein